MTEGGGSMKITFCYKTALDKDETMIPYDGMDEVAVSFEETSRNALSGVSSLKYAPDFERVSDDSIPDKKQENELLHFRLSDWAMIASIVDKNFEPLSLLLLNRRDHSFALVLKGNEPVVQMEFHGNLQVQDGVYEACYAINDYLEITGIDANVSLSAPPVASKPIDLGEAPEENEEDDVDMEAIQQIARPHFEATSSSKPKDLGRSQWERKEELETTQEEPETLDMTSFKKGFSGNSKKKPRNLDGISLTPKPAVSSPKPVATKPSITPAPSSKWNDEEAEYQRPKLQNASFESSKGKVLDLERKEGGFRTLPHFIYRRHTDWDYLFVRQGNEEDEKSFLQVNRLLKQRRFFELHPTCYFVPTIVSKNDPVFQMLKNFHAEDWIVCACLLNRSMELLSFVLCPKSNLDEAVVIAIKGNDYLVSCISSCGILVKEYHETILSKDACLRKEEIPLPTKKPKIEKESENLEPVLEEEEENIPLRKIPKRRLFLSRKFERSCEERMEVYRAPFEKALRKLYETAIFGEDQEWVDYLKKHDNASISTPHVRFEKFRFDDLMETRTDRIFFLRGDEFSSRGLNQKDIVFVYLTQGAEEHDRQGEIALRLDKATRDQMVIEQVLLPYESNHIDELAYPSLTQYQLLLASREQLPHAFVGSAGTGKTILSLKETLDLGDVNKRVLYLTYQKDLKNFAEKKLEELHAKNVETHTWKTLCRSLNLPQSDCMDDKSDFERFFRLLEEKNNRLYRRVANCFEGSKEDDCLVCYSFYRGVLEGLSTEVNPTGNILSSPTFLERTKKEEGYSLEQKQAIYEVGKAYENHLKAQKRTTDNRLAHELLEHINDFEGYDAIVIDEYQDLSEIQFEAVCGLLNHEYPSNLLNLYLYGDDNQAINPTIFDVKDAKRIVKKCFGNQANLYVSNLNDSYRSGPNLVGYINEVSRIRRKAIGARNAEVDSIQEVTKREDEEDVFVSLIQNNESFEKLLNAVSVSNRDCVFLFPNAKMRNDYQRKYQKRYPEFVEHSFLSVGNAKGREWDSCVLVNFFSSSKRTFESMLGEERKGKHSTLHRMLFNRYYVALTRAKNRIVIFEANAHGIIEEELLSGLRKLQSEKEVLSYFKGTIDPSHWMEEGDYRFNRDEFEDAIRAYSRAGDFQDAKSKIETCRQFVLASENALAYPETVRLYLNHTKYHLLRNYYQEHGEDNKKQFLYNLFIDPPDTTQLSQDYITLLPTFTEAEKKFYFSRLLKDYKLTLK